MAYYTGTIGTGTTIQVWNDWNITTSSTTGSYSMQVWDIWNTSYYAGSTTGAWTAWNTVASNVDLTSSRAARVETPEEVEARRIALEDIRKRSAVAAAERKLADAKARELLLSVLDHDQEEEFERSGHFHVHTANGLRTYRIGPAMAPTRIKSDDGYGYSYCIHPSESFPAGDTAAAQKLLLETDEQEFLRIANARRTVVLAPA